MVRVITIAREFGSGGAIVAGLLAERLHWRLLDRDLLVEIARGANVDPQIAQRYDERTDPWFHRLVKHALSRGGAEGPMPQSGDMFDSETMVAVGKRAIEEAARIGNCVVVGRGAQCILHGWPDAFHVFLYAPMRVRKNLVAERLGGRADLEAEIRLNDHHRAEFIRRHFGQEWCNPHLYDVMINTRHGCDSAAETILSAINFQADRA